jgi:WD40 repeat protein
MGMRNDTWLLVLFALVLAGCGGNAANDATPTLPWQTPISPGNAAQLALVSTLDTGRDFLDSIAFMRERPWVMAGSQTATNAANRMQPGVMIHDLATGSPIAAVQGRGIRLLLTDDPNILVELSDFGYIGLIDLTANETNELDFFDLRDFEDVAVSPDGRTVAAAGEQMVVLVNRISAEQVARFDHQGWVSAVTFSPDGTHIATGLSDGSIHLWDVASGAEIATWDTGDRPIYRLTFSPQGLLAAAAGNSVTLWDSAGETPALAATLEGHTDQVRDLAFNPDGSLLVTGGKEGRALVWSVDGTLLAKLVAERLGQFEPVWVNGVAFNGQGTLIGLAVADGTIRLWAIP